MSRTKINTYSPESYRKNYIQPASELDGMLKPDFARFFIVKVEKLIRLIKLPVPPVRTTNYTLIYLTEGTATMTIGSENHKIKKNDCLFVPAGQVHSFARHDKNKGYLANFSNDFIIGKFGTSELINDLDFLKVWGNPRIALDRDSSMHVEHIFKRLLKEYSDNGTANINILQSYFVALLCEIDNAQKPVKLIQKNHAQQITNRFKELLFVHFRSKHRVTDYASLLNMSPNHLNKVVKAASGKSPSRWIDEAIVLETKVLLHQSNYNISEVASDVGVLDQSYFSRLFKKYEGITPMQFRKRIENQNRVLKQAD